MVKKLTGALAVAAAAIVMYSQGPPLPAVGPLPQGGALLNTGWRIRPAGKTIPLSTLPMSAATAPDGRMLAVLNGGYLPGLAKKTAELIHFA